MTLAVKPGTTDWRGERVISADCQCETELVTMPQVQSPLQAINDILQHVHDYRERVKAFYFEVMLSPYACPKCGGALRMTGQSECSCQCGTVIDPTLAFQMSPCCQARLRRNTCHYTCSHCHKIVPSRFLFDERLFDKEYFRALMQESRQRAAGKKEEIRRLLADSRSGALVLSEPPELESIPGLLQDLDDFIRSNSGLMDGVTFTLNSAFNMAAYRAHILSLLDYSTFRFSDISPLTGDYRRDRVRRFITLIFMDNEQEVEIQQYGDDLLIQRRNNEAYSEG